jgi:transcriptional regulator of nitric oxide reductase
MFRPNQVGQLQRKTGYDVHARIAYAAAVPLPLAVVHDKNATQKTTVRSDSSASRGAAEELVAIEAKILVPKRVQVAVGDKVILPAGTYAILSTELRYSVFGILDHTECTLEKLP